MKKWKHLIATVSVVVVAAGCGGISDEGGDTTTGEPVTTDTQPEPSTTPAAETTMAPTTSEAPSTTSSSGAEEPEEGEEADGAADRTVDVIMDEFTFEPSVFEVSAGETVRFVVVNEGAIEHEFRASNAHRIEEHLASGHDDHDDDEEDHHEEDGDIVLVLQPGETGEVTVTFPEDTTIYTEIACLLPGHYEAGMKAPIDYDGS
jgi:uncharacterized cupredoxin-like copper-binding protein